MGYLSKLLPSLGVCSVLQVELWGILRGIRMAWESRFRNIIIESDSQVAIALVEDGCPSLHPYFVLVTQIRSFMSFLGNLKWRHILREANQVAGALAKHGLSLNCNCRFFGDVPSFIYVPLFADYSLVSFPRGL